MDRHNVGGWCPCMFRQTTLSCGVRCWTSATAWWCRASSIVTCTWMNQDAPPGKGSGAPLGRLQQEGWRRSWTCHCKWAACLTVTTWKYQMAPRRTNERGSSNKNSCSPGSLITDWGISSYWIVLSATDRCSNDPRLSETGLGLGLAPYRTHWWHQDQHLPHLQQGGCVLGYFPVLSDNQGYVIDLLQSPSSFSAYGRAIQLPSSWLAALCFLNRDSIK